jgi:hypothetical protein
MKFHAVSLRRWPASPAEKQFNGHQISGVLNAMITVAAVAQGVLFAVFLVRTAVLQPFSDMIAWIDAYLRLREQQVSLLEYLWAPHNEHHIVIIRLLTALDISMFRADGAPFVVAATVATTTTAVFVFLEFRRCKCLRGPLRSLALIAPMLLLTFAAAVDCSIPINTVYPLALVFVIAALALFDDDAELTPANAARRVGALVMAMMASLGNAAALVVWPALWWLAWRGRAGWKWLLATAATGAGYGFIYVHSIPTLGFNRPGDFTSAHLMKMGEYLLMYLGLPLSRADGLRLPALVLGASLLAAGSAALLFHTIWRRPETRLQRQGVAWVIVAVAAAVLAAVGRVDQETEVKIPVRYALLVAPLPIGLLALALPPLASRAATVCRQAALLGGALVCAGGLLMLHALIGRSAITVATDIRRTIDRYDAGNREPGMEKLIFRDLTVADRVLATLRQVDGVRR